MKLKLGLNTYKPEKQVGHLILHQPESSKSLCVLTFPLTGDNCPDLALGGEMILPYCFIELRTTSWSDGEVALPCHRSNAPSLNATFGQEGCLCLSYAFSLHSSAQPLLPQCRHWSHPVVKDREA